MSAEPDEPIECETCWVPLELGNTAHEEHDGPEWHVYCEAHCPACALANRSPTKEKL